MIVERFNKNYHRSKFALRSVCMIQNSSDYCRVVLGCFRVGQQVLGQVMGQTWKVGECQY